jgi:hypothetical protein
MPINPNQISPCGMTYAQIDAEEFAYVQAANDALGSLRGKGARWWYYSVGHRSFELVVGDPQGKGNLVLLLAGCDLISGPVNWPDQQLAIRWVCDRERQKAWEFFLEDASVNFRVVGGTFRWQKDYDLVRYGSIYVPRNEVSV